MTTATSPIGSLTDLAKERSSAMSASVPSKHHADYSERAEPRSMTMDYTTTSSNSNGHSNGGAGPGSSYSARHQQQSHYGQDQEYYSQQQQQQHYNNSSSSSGSNNNGHSHHSSSSSSSSSHYPHSSNGAYHPSSTQAPASAGHGNNTSNSGSSSHGNPNDASIYAPNHGHSHSMYGSFVSPTSPQLSSTGAPHVYQSQQGGHYDYDHPQAQYHAYHTHHGSHPQDHHQHPLSPASEGNGHHFYGSYPVPTGKVDNGNSLSNGSYSSSASSTHYSRSHPYSSSAHGYSSGFVHHSGHSASVDSGIPDGHGAGLGIGADNTSGKSDSSSMVYSTSAPSPSTVHSMVASRPKRRSEMFAHQESPYFSPALQHYNLYSADQSMSYNIKMTAKIDRGFFLAANDWTCYRRNYFQLSAAFTIGGLDSSIRPEVPCLLERNGELVTVRAFLVCIGAHIQSGEKVIELVQHTPKRDKGPQITPRPTLIRAGGDLSLSSSGSNPNVVTFERVQFKTATANNGKRRAAQQYYQVHVDLFAELDNGDLMLVATTVSAPLVVRGRSPGHYADNDDTPLEGSHAGDSRYHYRNDSVSSAGGGPLGSPVSPGEYSYYSGYSYGSSYPYQSLGSASHIAAQSHESGYYDRKDSESYPASPLSPAGPHPAESVSPDMYSPSGFVGPESSASYSRIAQISNHQSGYNSAYSQYSSYNSQQHQDMYRDSDHETQMAGLRIHSPTSPMPSTAGVSPAATPRRQSFSSSLISKNTERNVGGSTTRKSRSISLSGTTTTTTVSKLPSNKARSARTVPATPTRDMNGKSSHHGYSKDRIPESLMEEQHLS